MKRKSLVKVMEEMAEECERSLSPEELTLMKTDLITICRKYATTATSIEFIAIGVMGRELNRYARQYKPNPVQERETSEEKQG